MCVRRIIWWLCLWLVLGLLVGCVSASEPPKELSPYDQQVQAIINGQPDSRHPAVGAITAGTQGAFCTGTLITPKLVVTAAHCVDAMGKYGGASGCRFRTDASSGSVHHTIQQAIKHPSYNPRSSTLSDYDIAVLILNNAVSGVTPIPANADPVDATWVGRKVLVMGYGLIQTQPTPQSAPSKYSAEIPIFQVSGNQMVHKDQTTGKSACHGDSGGPALYTVNGELRVIGVTSTATSDVTKNPNGNPPTLCDAGTVDTLTSANHAGFLQQYIAQTGSGCQAGSTRACYSGPAGTKGVGLCAEGSQICQHGQWGPCTGEVLPAAQETCFDSKDNNCNNQVDEGCGECQEGQTQPCYTGPPGTEVLGACKQGQKTCRGGKWSSCEGEVKPAPQEICGNQIDDNCNNQVDENCRECQEGQTQSCYTGPPATQDIGACRAGLKTCRDGKWSGCEGSVLPAAQETCGDGQDNNCNNQVDEGCTTQGCQEGTTRACYAGPPGSENQGICQAGTQQCTGGQWGACVGQVTPVKERCQDRTDNDCDGQVDEDCSGLNGQSTSPYLPQGFGCSLSPTTHHPPALLWIWLLFGLFVFVKRRSKKMSNP